LTRVWRSRRVAWLALIVAFALIAAACGGDDEGGEETTTTTTTEAETTTTTQADDDTTTTTTASNLKPYGGEVIVGDDQEPPTLNSFVPGGDNAIVSLIGQSYWAGVQEISGFTLELIPELVTEIPTVDNGGVTVNADGTMTVRYEIVDEAQWSDGVPISGDDFKFTYDTIMDPDLPILKAIYEDIIPESIVVGPKTFEYTLSAPTVQYDLIFGQIIPKHEVEGSDFVNDWNDTMWVSAGPFVFDTWQKGEFIRVVRNDNYWKTDAETGQQLPYLDSVVFRFIPETESLITAFRSRELDVIQPPPATETIETLQALEPEGAKVEVLSGPVWEHLSFTVGEASLDRNPDSSNQYLNYRKAVAHAVDKDLIVDEILAGQVEPLYSWVTPYSPTLSNDDWLQYDYNPDTAMGYLDDLCEELSRDCAANPITTVFTTTSNNDARVKLSELFVDMFTAVGIDYENQLEESSLFFGETTTNGNYDLGEWAWLGTPGFSGLVSSMDLFDPEQPPPDGQNYYRFGAEGSLVITDWTARLAELRDLANATVDQDEIVGYLDEFTQIMADNVIIIPLYARLVTAASWGDKVGGYKHNPSQAAHTWNIEDWYRVDL
jgi:peptide/nickel transport system substrate-binding protein